MATISIIGGAGYVGLAYSALLADLGHTVVSIDRDPFRIASLQQGNAPNHEPGLQPILDRVVQAGRLTFTTDGADAIRDSTFVFICVGTPGTPGGAADTTAIVEAARTIARHGSGHTIVVNKSTMPVGSVAFVADILSEHAAGDATFSVVSNPEFLREGSAISDIYHPDRIVLGSDDPVAAAAVGELYAPLQAPQLFTHPRSAEMIKYASNAFLASKISFINEIATICEHLGADITAVVTGMGLDERIAPHFLRPGIGFGGSCFPKDVRALARLAQDHGCDPTLLTTALKINESMLERVMAKIRAAIGPLSGARIGVLGLAFKPDTDDIRESPAITLIHRLRDAGANVRATDPVARRNATPLLPQVHLAPDAYGAAMGADAVVLATDWDEYKILDMDRLANAMHGTFFLDGRNAVNPDAVTRAGLVYEGIGRSDTTTPSTIRTMVIPLVSDGHRTEPNPFLNHNARQASP